MHIFRFLVAFLPLVVLTAANAQGNSVQVLNNPIDALSVTLNAIDATAEVRYEQDGEWSDWQALVVENEQDPTLLESNLIIFPEGTRTVALRGENAIAAIHPIQISDQLVSYKVAATTNTTTPKILSRSEWGADDSLLFRSNDAPAPSAPPEGNGDTAPASQREKDCAEAQLNYPDEFKSTGRTTKVDGKTLRWTREYSKSVKLLAIHHTAIKVSGDDRSGADRVRALYTYHANSRGWGDIGYHFLIDENGQMYEGKSGGDFVVGGHAYCNNVGTIGIALLGNFEEERPTQDQLKSLQWLLDDLAKKYDIDTSKKVTHHGKQMDPIVGHQDLVSTECPGFYVYGALAQIRKHVRDGDVYASVSLPKKPTASRVAARTSRASSQSPVELSRSRRVQRLLDSDASKNLRRKLGTNPGKEVESGVAARLAARKADTTSSSTFTASSRSSKKSSASSSSSVSSAPSTIRIRLTRQENGSTSCSNYDLETIRSTFRGTVHCVVVDGVAALINTVPLEEYMAGLAEEPDTEPYEKQRAFAIAARSYAAHYISPDNRKFPGKPYDGSDSPATFQLYGGIAFERINPNWVKAVASTSGKVIVKDGKVVKTPYFSSSDGRTRSPEEAGWKNFPFAEVFSSKDDPWCVGEALRGHGVGMSGCGSEAQANEGKTAEEILGYYYPGTTIDRVSRYIATLIGQSN